MAVSRDNHDTNKLESLIQEGFYILENAARDIPAREK